MAFPVGVVTDGAVGDWRSVIKGILLKEEWAGEGTHLAVEMQSYKARNMDLEPRWRPEGQGKRQLWDLEVAEAAWQELWCLRDAAHLRPLQREGRVSWKKLTRCQRRRSASWGTQQREEWWRVNKGRKWEVSSTHKIEPQQQRPNRRSFNSRTHAQHVTHRCRLSPQDLFSTVS